ncbi:MAG: hypothetical protein ACRYFS_01765 [Janthinobacterium lividum]
MHSRSLLLLYLGFWLGMLLSPVTASGTLPPSHTYLATKELSQNTWLTEAWTAKERPFVLARRSLEATIQSQHNALQLATALEASATKHPKYAVLLFRWGLATYYASQSRNIVWKPPMIDRLLAALDEFPSPHSAEFMRMRFLIEAHYNVTPDLKLMGLRLLTRDPSDDAVRASMYPLLNVIGSPADGRLALTFARELIAKHPTTPKWHAMLGAAYYNIAIHDNTIANCSASVRAYQKYLEMASPNDPFREQAKLLIKEMQKTMPKQ